MYKYAIIKDTAKGLCTVGDGSNEKFYKSIGMELLDVQQSDVDGLWYLIDKCPMKTDEQKAQEEAQRVALLNLTGADVERAIYKAKGMDFDDIIAFLEAQPLAQDGTAPVDIKALKIELKANNFYRGNPYIDTVGTLLGFTKEQLDDFFDSLYAGYNIRRVNAVRMINCRSERRGEIKELLISNYDAEDEPKECDRNMTRTFTSWIDSFKDTIADYKYFIDFDKVHHNIGAIKVELNILNSLIGSQKIEEDFDHLVSDYPSVLKCIPLLLAVRSSEICVYDSGKKFLYDFTNGAAACEYKIFMRETGLFDLIANHVISSLVDYATGVETGLDSNGRKNRGGHLMENLVEGFLMEAGLKRDIDYFKEMYASEIKSRWGLDMSALSNGGRADKRFDFVVKTSSVVYGIETNFYTAGGSKLNETSRSYKQLALEAKEVKGFEFVWFTDGKGWKSARHNLEETFDVMEHLYNINDLENGIAKEIFK